MNEVARAAQNASLVSFIFFILEKHAGLMDSLRYGFSCQRGRDSKTATWTADRFQCRCPSFLVAVAKYRCYLLHE